MSRFIDRLLVSPGMIETSATMREGVIILGDNVSDYYWMGNPQEVWVLEKDFPNVAPPFDRFFIDFRAPAEIISEVNGRMPWPDEKAREWGVFFESEDIYVLAERMEQPEKRQGVQAALEWHLSRWERIIHGIQEDVRPLAGHDPYGVTVPRLTPIQRWYIEHYRLLQKEVKLLREGDWHKAQRSFLERHQETGTKWLVRAHLYLGLQRDDGYRYVPAWLWDFQVNGQGQFVLVGDTPVCHTQPKQQYLLQVLPGVAKKFQVELREATKMMAEAMVHYFYPALLAISFMHCKNVAIRQTSPSNPLPQAKKKSKKSAKSAKPRITYHILDIEPLKEVLRTEGQIEKQGLKKALHICRGHFANYESGRGLFGKYHGTYWIPQHTRGSAAQGLHLKDYRLKNVEQGRPTQED